MLTTQQEHHAKLGLHPGWQHPTLLPSVPKRLQPLQKLQLDPNYSVLWLYTFLSVADAATVWVEVENSASATPRPAASRTKQLWGWLLPPEFCAPGPPVLQKYVNAMGL